MVAVGINIWGPKVMHVNYGSDRGVVFVCCAAGVLQLRSVKAGETVIQSVATSLFLCVDDEDNLKGQVWKWQPFYHSSLAF